MSLFFARRRRHSMSARSASRVMAIVPAMTANGMPPYIAVVFPSITRPARYSLNSVSKSLPAWYRSSGVDFWADPVKADQAEYGSSWGTSSTCSTSLSCSSPRTPLKRPPLWASPQTTCRSQSRWPPPNHAQPTCTPPMPTAIPAAQEKATPHIRRPSNGSLFGIALNSTSPTRCRAAERGLRTSATPPRRAHKSLLCV